MPLTIFQPITYGDHPGTIGGFSHTGGFTITLSNVPFDSIDARSAESNSIVPWYGKPELRNASGPACPRMLPVPSITAPLASINKSSTATPP